MALANTTIITDDVAEHQELLDLLWSPNIVLMVILGKTPGAIAGTTTASNYTGDSRERYKRWVLRIENPSDLTDQSIGALHKLGLIEDIKNVDTNKRQKIKAELKDIKAFCLGINPRKSYSQVHLNSTLKRITIKKLFTEAEKNSKKTS